MLLIRAYLAPSSVDGIGLFAAEPIAKGTIIWTFDSRIDRLFSLEEKECLPEPLRTFLRIYSYPRYPGASEFILDGDHARFMNHSKMPNTCNIGSNTTAAINISVGEELLCDYDEFYPGHGLLTG
jgi:SET domain-containing protein